MSPPSAASQVILVLTKWQGTFIGNNKIKPCVWPNDLNFLQAAIPLLLQEWRVEAEPILQRANLRDLIGSCFLCIHHTRRLLALNGVTLRALVNGGWNKAGGWMEPIQEKRAIKFISWVGHPDIICVCPTLLWVLREKTLCIAFVFMVFIYSRIQIKKNVNGSVLYLTHRCAVGMEKDERSKLYLYCTFYTSWKHNVPHQRRGNKQGWGLNFIDSVKKKY